MRDARVLSQVSCRIDLPSVHIPSEQSRELKALCTSREALVKVRTQLINRLRSDFRSRLGRPVKATSRTLPRRARTALAKHPDGVPSHIEAVLVTVETLNIQIRKLDNELASLGKQDEVCRRLMTVPGVGPVTAVRFRAAVDELGRFVDGSRLSSYLGLTPGERSTGFVPRRTGLTKAGPSQVRHPLGQAAWTLWRRRPDDPIVQWARQVAERRGKQVAVMALARKLVLVLYAIWRDGSVYDPTRGRPTATRDGAPV